MKMIFDFWAMIMNYCMRGDIHFALLQTCVAHLFYLVSSSEKQHWSLVR
jgi:hypothetical protein